MLPLQAAAQTLAPSQVTPRSIAPLVVPPGAAPVAREVEADPSLPEDDDLAFTPAEVLIEGAFPELASFNAAFAAQLRQRRITVSALFAAARDLEQAYAREGYVLARVTVPHQRIANGQPVRVVVTDGFIEAVAAEQVPASFRPLVMARLGNLTGRRHLTEAQIERRLLATGQMPGLALRSALAPGREPGGVLLVAEGTARRLTARVVAENPLPAALGRWQVAGNLALNNLVGAGEQIYLTGATGLGLTGLRGGELRRHAPLAMLGGGIVLPLGSAGVTIAGEYLSSRTRPGRQQGVPEALGMFDRVQGRLRVPLVLRRATTLHLDVTLEGLRQSLRLPGFALDLSRDRYGALRVGLGARGWLGTAVLSIETAFSQGLGGRAATTLLPLSRQGATARFSRIEGAIRAGVPLAGGFGLDLVVRGQTGLGEAQLLPEQFALEAADGISTFASGSFNVDSGATARSELRLPVPAFGHAVQFAPYVFLGAGTGTLAQPTALEQRRLAAGAVGVGARLALGGTARGARIGIEYGYQVSNAPARRAGNRAAVSLAFEF